MQWHCWLRHCCAYLVNGTSVVIFHGRISSKALVWLSSALSFFSLCLSWFVKGHWLKFSCIRVISDGAQFYRKSFSSEYLTNVYESLMLTDFRDVRLYYIRLNANKYSRRFIFFSVSCAFSFLMHSLLKTLNNI